jgi:signal transduction histidine kinase
MFRVLGCVIEQHDISLVALAGALCLFACIATMSMIRRARATDEGAPRLAWIASAGVVAGSGIWGTHFVAMLAYQAGFPVAYQLGLTLFSALIAMTMSGVGIYIALNFSRPWTGGALMGAAIGAMHYVGMAAVRAPADAVWDWNYVAASVVIGIGLMAAGMDFVVRRGTRTAYILGAVVFTLAICSMHFTGMSAVAFRFDPLVAVSDAVMAPGMLAIAVAASAVLIVALGLMGAIVDGHLQSRAEGESRRLRAHISELETAKLKLEQMSSELEHALADAGAANAAKSQFLATMSHELRTPLNAVIGFSDVMYLEMFGPLTPRYREYAGDIKTSAAHLLSLINDILDLSRLDAKKLDLIEERRAPRALVEQALQLLKGQAHEKSVKLIDALPEGLPDIVVDERRFKQVLINLLSNAVKFTPSGGAVTLRAWRNGDGLSLSVTDTGIGIAPKDQARALERFGQVDSTLARKFEGTGLGLPLARDLMVLHGGTLTLESAVGKGTTVTVTIPAMRLVEGPIKSAA